METKYFSSSFLFVISMVLMVQELDTFLPSCHHLLYLARGWKYFKQLSIYCRQADMNFLDAHESIFILEAKLKLKNILAWLVSSATLLGKNYPAKWIFKQLFHSETLLVKHDFSLKIKHLLSANTVCQNNSLSKASQEHVGI